MTSDVENDPYTIDLYHLSIVVELVSLVKK